MGAAPAAQEVLLVPRTVYVPYAAQTPVAPVRMVGVEAPPALVPQRLAPLGVAPECRPPQGATPPNRDLDELNERLERIENALKRADQMECDRPSISTDSCLPDCPPAKSSWLPRLRRGN